MSPTSRVGSMALALLVSAAALIAFATPIGAEGGVPIPAPAGTTWTIVAGYNTGTHAWHDRCDPHALDITRTDASTDWTPVLAPVNGIVEWFDYNGVVIVDRNGYGHLLVHIEPAGDLWRGKRVKIGDQLGRVFPVGYDANGGIAHIHYAIHETSGGGQLDCSVPFTGAYAIEGRELHWSDEYNLHFGVEFVSTNTPDWTAGPGIPSEHESSDGDAPTGDERASVPEPEPEPVWTIPADAPVGGWRTIGVQRRTSVAGLYSLLQAPLSELVVHDAHRDTYGRFDPTDPDSADVAVRSLQAGEAVWALVEPSARWLPAPPAEPQQVTIRMRSGANLISWQGPDRQVAEALRNVAHLSRAYRFDPYSGSWQFWSPEAPDFVNSLGTLRSGDALYVVVRVGSIWTQLP